MSYTSRSLVAVLSATLLLGLADGQEPTKPPPEAPPAAPPPKHEFQVLPLKNAAAVDTARLLNELFGGARPGRAGLAGAARVVADPSSNSLLIQAAPADLDAIRGVLAKIDAARPDQEAVHSKLSVFQLKHVEPDKPLEDALKLLTAGRGFSLDKQRKLVIVNTEKRLTEEIEALLSRMEDQANRPPTPDVQVRVVWLMNIPAKEDDPKDQSPAPPVDLKALLPDLAKLGIDRPRLAAQILVNVTPGTEFAAAGRSSWFGDSRFSVSGRYTEKTEVPSLRLEARATNKGPAGAAADDLGHIQTEITAPIGHLVVLGVTPTDTTTSVFIVQVLRPKSPGR